MAKFHVNDKVWFYRWDAICCGKIYCVVEDLESMPCPAYGLRLDTVNGISCPGTTKLLETNAFASEEDCRAFVLGGKKQKVAEFIAEIKTVQDLIQFLFDHQVFGEDRDEEAREAALTVAEKFGFKIDN